MRKSWLMLCVVGCGLSGCMTPTAIGWIKAGGTDENFRADANECERDAERSAREAGYFGTGVVAIIEVMQRGQDCMKSRGYQQVAVPDARAYPLLSLGLK